MKHVVEDIPMCHVTATGQQSRTPAVMHLGTNLGANMAIVNPPFIVRLLNFFSNFRDSKAMVLNTFPGEGMVLGDPKMGPSFLGSFFDICYFIYFF